MEFEELKRVRILHQATFVYLISGPIGIRYSTSHTIHLVYFPPKFCISIVIISSWDDCNPQEKLKTKDVQNLGGK